MSIQKLSRKTNKTHRLMILYVFKAQIECNQNTASCCPSSKIKYEVITIIMSIMPPLSHKPPSHNYAYN